MKRECNQRDGGRESQYECNRYEGYTMDRKHENIAKSRTHRHGREDKNRHLILIHLKFTLFAFHPSPPVYQRKYRNTEPHKAVPTDQQPTLTASPFNTPQEETEKGRRWRKRMQKQNVRKSTPWSTCTTQPLLPVRLLLRQWFLVEKA
jgi:hypothetical protein